MTDNRANEQLSGISGQFTNEQVEAAYQAWITFPHKRGPQNAENAIRAALEAAARAAQGAGVGPQEPCPQPCEHLSAEDAREGRDCREHPCTCPTAQSSDRENLIDEARAVVPQAETPQCGPCRRGQHGCCDGNEYLRCDCGHVTPVLPSSTVDVAKIESLIMGRTATAGARAVADWLKGQDR